MQGIRLSLFCILNFGKLTCYDSRLHSDKIDIIGDVHGHYQELDQTDRKNGIFIGEINCIIRKSKTWLRRRFYQIRPQSVEVLNLVKSLHEEGTAMAVFGNHEFRFIQDPVEGRESARI